MIDGSVQLHILQGSLLAAGAELSQAQTPTTLHSDGPNALPVRCVSESASLELCSIFQEPSSAPAAAKNASLDTPDGSVCQVCGSRDPQDVALPDSVPGCRFIRSGPPETRLLRHPPAWEESVQNLIEESQEDEAPVRVMVVGGRNSGKSTLLRLLVNRLLTQTRLPTGGTVQYLDADVGQPEFTPSGVVSLLSLRTPYFGMPQVHQIGDLSRGASDSTLWFGGNNPEEDPELYLQLVRSLFQTYTDLCTQHHHQRHHHQRQRQPRRQQSISTPGSSPAAPPLVLNTCGWITGLGAKLIARIAEIVRPTHVLFLDKHLNSGRSHPSSHGPADTSLSSLDEHNLGTLCSQAELIERMFTGSGRSASDVIPSDLFGYDPPLESLDGTPDGHRMELSQSDQDEDGEDESDDPEHSEEHFIRLYSLPLWWQRKMKPESREDRTRPSPRKSAPRAKSTGPPVQLPAASFLRTLTFAAYFHLPVRPIFQAERFNGQARRFCSRVAQQLQILRPYTVRLPEVYLAQHPHQARDVDILRVLNASVVGLCTGPRMLQVPEPGVGVNILRLEDRSPFRSPQQDGEEDSFQRGSRKRMRLDSMSFGFRSSTFSGQEEEEEKARTGEERDKRIYSGLGECLGFGIVRAVDRAAGKLYLLTPIAAEELEKVLVIVKGSLEFPEALLDPQDQLRRHHQPYLTPEVKAYAASSAVASLSSSSSSSSSSAPSSEEMIPTAPTVSGGRGMAPGRKGVPRKRLRQ